MRGRLVSMLVAFCFSCIVAAHADPITWNLVNVEFSDGGTADGYIVFDATRRVVLDFDVHVSDGGSLDTFEYTTLNSGMGLSGGHSALGAFSLGALTETRQLYLEVLGQFDLPAALTIDAASYERCYTGPCQVGFRTVEGQMIATPEPWSLAMFGSALILLPQLRPLVVRS